MNKISQILSFTILLFFTYIGDLCSIASSGNYYITRGIAIILTIFNIWFLFFTKEKLKLPVYIFYLFIILNGMGLCYASSMLIASFFI